jgi:hypothetical protein
MSDDFNIDLGKLRRDAEQHLSNAQYRRKYERRDFFVPNPAQQRLLDTTARFVFFQSGNQVGKSTVAAEYVSHYATDTTIPNYTGRVWSDPKLHRAYKRVVWILAGQTGQTALMGMQSALFGDVLSGQIGTGMVPLRAIKKVTYAHGTPGLISEAVIETDNGENALIRIRTYAQGQEALTSEAVDLIICDELPPDMALFTELTARLTATNGRLFLIATPNRQGSPVPRWFMDGKGDKQIVRGSLAEVTHISQEEIAKQAEIYKSISDAEYRTRFHGDPFAGGGNVLRFNIQDIYSDIDRQQLGPSTRYILGLDISHGGLSSRAHPHAAVAVALDQLGVYHVLYAQRWQGIDLANFAMNIHHWEVGDAPAAWGQDFLQGIAGTNETYASMLKDYGLNMLHKHTTTAAGSTSAQAGYGIIQTLINAGRLKIQHNCHDLIEEMAALEYDLNGKIIAQFDDIASALRYAIVMAEEHNSARELLPTEGGGLRRGSQYTVIDSGRDPIWGHQVQSPRVVRGGWTGGGYVVRSFAGDD